MLCCALCRFVSLVVVCYLDRTSLAFAALQLCDEDWFNAKVYGLVSTGAALLSHKGPQVKFLQLLHQHLF